MRRRVFLGSLGGAVLMWPLQLCAQQTATGISPLCIYDSKSFSEGADICVQAGLFMTCSVVDGRPEWTVVTDKDLSRICVVPFQQEFGDRPRISVRRHVVRRSLKISSAPLSDIANKCFSFNGKRYCE
jgi:hypothetical protein